MQQSIKRRFSLRAITAAFFAVLCCSSSYAQDTQPADTSSSAAPTAPQIIIQSPTPNQKVNATKLLVKGEVMDDGEVVSIIIGDVSLGVSGSRIPFQYPVYLKNGKNEIRVEAVDSQGNKSTKTLTVFSDSKGTPAKTKMSTPVEVSKTSVKNETGIPSIPELPSKTIIVKKEEKQDYVKITSSPTAVEETTVTTQPELFVTESKKSSKKKPVMVVAKATKKQGYAYTKTTVRKKKAHRVKKHWNPARQMGDMVTITPRLMVNDRSVYVTIKPVLRQGRTYAALEENFTSKLGVQVVHDRRGGKQFVYLIAKGKTVKLQVGGRTLYSNGNAVGLGAPLRVKQGRVMVPFRVVCEELGFYVNWDTETRTASAHQH